MINVRNQKWILWLGLFVVGVGAGAVFFGGSSAPETASHSGETQASIWTCSMHPQVQAPGPGKCPICFMDLIPVESSEEDAGDTRLSMSESAMHLADLVTTPVQRLAVKSQVRTVGKVAVDERRINRITARVGGRLDRLYVDYTGVAVSEGDHLVDIYSPELYSAQVELIGALKAQKSLAGSDVAFLTESADATVEAAREKLRLLGLRPEQIQEIESRRKPDEHITLHAPSAGVVIHKAAVEGEYVKTGSPIYTIADLTEVWVLLDVYESDLVWVQLGQDVTFEVEAFPGERFVGHIAFIDRVVNPVTRTVKVRLNVENADQRLKPDMFVRAVIRSSVTGDGRSLRPDLAGKWICPMHLEVVKNAPGTCDICGMALVTAESLGLVRQHSEDAAPLVIPVTAPLITGKRAIVYVRVPGTKSPTFEGREIVLGPRAGDYYIVEQGLVEGEEVVTHGSFKIDSAMQIQAKPSMMSPQDGARLEPSPGLRRDLAPLFRAYFDIQGALAQDDLDGARRGAETLALQLSNEPGGDLTPAARTAWDDWVGDLKDPTARERGAETLDAARAAFDDLSSILIEMDRSVGPPGEQSHHLIFCPMAFNSRGAYWLQESDQVHNPFFGQSMPGCGEVKDTFGTPQPGEDQ